MKKALHIMLIITIAFIFTVIGLFIGLKTIDGEIIIQTRESNRNKTIVEETKSYGLININNASSDELQELPGIGKVTAESIIEYRNENGPFMDTKEIMRVKGIGEKTYEELRSMITVEEPS